MIPDQSQAVDGEGMASQAQAPVMEVRDLHRHFLIGATLINRVTGRRPQVLRAVDGVSFDIVRGEVLGLVGESGSGKTTLGRCMLRLTEPSSGQIRFEGDDILSLEGAQLRPFRRQAQIIFQNPYASLNPRMKVGQMLAEVLLVHRMCSQDEVGDRVRELLHMVGLPPKVAQRYPSMFSGGQRQRISIARALALRPKFLVADEPVSSLDVSVQAQILNLLLGLKRELGFTMMFIAHDLGVIRYIADRVAVMYLGRIVELAPAHELFEEPWHPYTRALLRSVPCISTRHLTAVEEIPGDPPSPLDLPTGCRFSTRCSIARQHCTIEEPALLTSVGAGRAVACWAWQAGWDETADRPPVMSTGTNDTIVGT